MRNTMTFEVAPGVVFQVEAATPCGHCGKLVLPRDSTVHLLTCSGAPEEIHALARAAQALDALLQQDGPETHERSEAEREQVRTAAAELGRRVADADYQKNPLVTDEILLEDVDSFGGEEKPWFHAVVRDAALARIRERRCVIASGGLA